MLRRGSVVGGTLLVAGTCIGGGMLALPVLTSPGGFIPSSLIFALCWIFMCCTGLLFLECCQWMEGDTNIISMAGKTLGRFGQGFAWVVYLYLFYCLTLAYMVGCGNLVSHFFELPDRVGPLLFTAFFAPVVLGGARLVGKVNAFLMGGLVLSYAIFVVLGSQYVHSDFLLRMSWEHSLLALPIAFAAFGFQGIVPTLFRYMRFDYRKTQLVILCGSFIPFFCYVIWEGLILGVIPQSGLAEALARGESVVIPLKRYIENESIRLLGNCLAFFALTTSFYGVTLGLFDFLSDGLHVQRVGMGKLILFLLVFSPPLLFATLYPGIFLVALDFAGGFGGALLLGLLPILMVWSGRYRLHFETRTPLPGGRVTLFCMVVFVLFEIVFELTRQF